MKLLPLSVKKKISKVMKRLGGGTATVLIAGSFFGGLGSMLGYEFWGDEKERVVLQEKVDHLLTSYKNSQSMHTVVEMAAGTDLAMDVSKLRKKEAALAAAFNSEAEQTGIALAHARKVSPHQRNKLYSQLDEIKPRPDYVREGKTDDEGFVLFSFAQSRVMDKPGFQPTIETAREIVQQPGYGGLVFVSFFTGPLLLSIGGVFGFYSARRRLDESIYEEELAISRAKDEAARKEKEEAQKAEAESAAQKAAEAAEAERIAKLPPSVALDRDISVRQIRLTGKVQTPQS